MTFSFRITDRLLAAIHADLSRPHRFAFERVGFIRCRVGVIGSGSIILAESYGPVADDDYLECDHMGALMGPAAIRKALQESYRSQAAMFHVHRHEHRGVPVFSPVDNRENAKLIPDFWKVASSKPHGAIVLSFDRCHGMVWDAKTRTTFPLRRITATGFPSCRLGEDHG